MKEGMKPPKSLTWEEYNSLFENVQGFDVHRIAILCELPWNASPVQETLKILIDFVQFLLQPTSKCLAFVVSSGSISFIDCSLYEYKFKILRRIIWFDDWDTPTSSPQGFLLNTDNKTSIYSMILCMTWKCDLPRYARWSRKWSNFSKRQTTFSVQAQQKIPFFVLRLLSERNLGNSCHAYRKT